MTETLPPLRRAVVIVVVVVTVLLCMSELLLLDVFAGVVRMIIDGPALEGVWVWVCARLSDSSSTWRKSCC